MSEKKTVSPPFLPCQMKPTETDKGPIQMVGFNFLEDRLGVPHVAGQAEFGTPKEAESRVFAFAGPKRPPIFRLTGQ